MGGGEPDRGRQSDPLARERAGTPPDDDRVDVGDAEPVRGEQRINDGEHVLRRSRFADRCGIDRDLVDDDADGGRARGGVDGENAHAVIVEAKGRVGSVDQRKMPVCPRE